MGEGKAKTSVSNLSIAEVWAGCDRASTLPFATTSENCDPILPPSQREPTGAKKLSQDRNVC